MDQNISKPSCGRFPLLVDLNITDTYWQVLDITNGTFYLFNAFYDDREALKNVSLVRILGLINNIDQNVKTFCQLWYDEMKEAIISEVIDYQIIWNKRWKQNTKGATPYLISCKNPLQNHNFVPQHVSLTEYRCDKANNVMKIRNKRPKNGHKKLFIVSVKSIDFENDISLQLIEWLEILKILAVDKVEIFVTKANTNVLRVLQFYQSEGFVTTKFLKFPKKLPNKRNESLEQWMQNDLIPYHDTFYENLYLYEFLIPMDIDEIIIPMKSEDRTWKDLMQRILSQSEAEYDAYPVINRFFLLKGLHEKETYEGIPKKLRFLSNIYRADKNTPTRAGAKTFMRTDRVIAVHNHFPISCFKPAENCRYVDVYLDDAQLSHFRNDCDSSDCKEARLNPTKDTTMWKLKNEILNGVRKTIEKIKNFKSDLDGKFDIEFEFE